MDFIDEDVMSQSVTTNNEPIWVPDQLRIDASNLQRFIKHIEFPDDKINNFDDLHRWSVRNKQDFWREVWQFCGVIGDRGESINAEGLAHWGAFQSNRDTNWFPQAQLNYAENLLAHTLQAPDDIAVWFNNERGEGQTVK